MPSDTPWHPMLIQFNDKELGHWSLYNVARYRISLTARQHGRSEKFLPRFCLKVALEDRCGQRTVRYVIDYYDDVKAGACQGCESQGILCKQNANSSRNLHVQS